MDDYYIDEYDEKSFGDDDFYDEDTYAPITFFEIWLNCISPSVKNAGSYIITFVLVNFILRLVAKFGLPDYINHLASTITGLFLLFYSLDSGTYYFFGLVVATYLLLVLLIFLKVKRLGLVFAVCCMTLLMFCELIETDAKLWHQIRGIQMIAVMKTMSLVFDLEAGKISNHKNEDNLLERKLQSPNILRYMGYMICPANCILGPWCSYQEYLEAFRQQPIDAKYFLQILVNSIVSVLFLILSNCVITFVISDNSWKWLLAYRDALSFRCSHYFVSFLSQATMVTAGFTEKYQTAALNKEQGSVFGYEVVRPQLVEFPRSLVQVVIGWNIPMHYWLKHYIFRVLKPHGIFLSIFTTYLMSSLLHGLNLQLAAVLLSLGLYTYIEYKLRSKIGGIFNACILANKCKPNCLHPFKSNNFKVLLTNLAFSVLTVFHLAYLGVMFEASFTLQESGFSLQHTLTKWKELDYASHCVVGFYYIFYYLI